MTIEAKAVAHSRADGAPDLITLQVKYPRMVHAEFMTHRVFSRNASSSRAIPIERMIRDVEEDPAMPVAWGTNKPGMQAGDEIPLMSRERAETRWRLAAKQAVHDARALAELDLHKQIVNRLLEPFAHISVVVTATNWDNFFALRCHPDADPTMRAVAEAMRAAIVESTPRDQRGADQIWHLPYTQGSDWDYAWALIDTPDGGPHPFNTLAMISAARCARVSYLNHDGSDPDIEKDLALAKRLLESKHMSPFEHQAQADVYACFDFEWGNFTSWQQHRKMVEA